MIQAVLNTNEDPTPERDQWRIPFLEKLLVQRRDMEYRLEEDPELMETIDALCSS